MTITATPTSNDPLLPKLKSIDKLITQGHLPKAAKELNAAVKAAPEDPRVYMMGARMAEVAGNRQGSVDAARKAAKLAPHWPPAVTELALALARMNLFVEAISTAERAVELDGNNPEILARVIDVAHRAQHYELASAWLTRAAAISPDNLVIKHMIARNLRILGRHAQSIEAYGALIAAAPNDHRALHGRIQAAIASGDLALARQDSVALLALLPDNEEAKYWLALAHGETPARQPVAMVRELYDNLAEFYDQHTVASLKYKLPREVAAIIRQHYPDNTMNVLDLGCGTGLLGVCLGSIQGALVGVDVSERMIEQAARHNVYHRFHNVDLLEALEATPEALYDVITALDVFIYVGDLARAIPDALRILKPGGHLIFSCETAREDEADLVLRPSQRYAHKASHVKALCRDAGFTEIKVEEMPLRLENQAPVDGFLLIARKPVA